MVLKQNLCFCYYDPLISYGTLVLNCLFPMETIPFNLYTAVVIFLIKMIIIRYGEISLKGKNRSFFENKLIRNIKLSIKNNLPIKKLRNRILIDTNEKLNLTKIFGIVNYSYADELEIDLDKIKQKSLSLLNKAKSFRITCKRLDKSIPFNSLEIEKDVGEYVFENSNAKVDLKNHEKNIQIELFNNKAYLFTEKIKSVGGLPVGIEGNAIALIENKDSINAALAVMKRGCDIIPVAFKKINIDKLKPYRIKKEVIIIKEFKEIEAIAEKYKSKVLVVNQKLNNFKKLDTNLLILRPLIAE